MHLAPTLTVNLAAIVANWQLLRGQFTGEECAAVVKADGYGLGAVEVATALEKAGCHTFFVATLDEALQLRAALPDIRILVLHGVQAGEEFAFAAHRLIPILNSHAQVMRWKPVALEHVHAVSALHVDTAMGRMGLQPEEFAALVAHEHGILSQCRVGLVMSHLACAPEAEHPLNAQQLELFQTIATHAPGIPLSLCNSGGIFLPKAFHFNLARPGCSLYGIAPQSRDSSATSLTSPFRGEVDAKRRVGVPFQPLQGTPTRPMGDLPPEGGGKLRHVATWHAPILMTRTLERAQTVGYGATITAEKGTRIATVASGYADGYLRHLSNEAVGYIGEHRVKLLGRVTMDMLCFDVTEVPEPLTADGTMLTLLGDAEGIRVDDVATLAGTIGYEILTRIGARVRRVYA